MGRCQPLRRARGNGQMVAGASAAPGLSRPYALIYCFPPPRMNFAKIELFRART
jgi:hypothetical protein